MNKNIDRNKISSEKSHRRSASCGTTILGVLFVSIFLMLLLGGMIFMSFGYYLAGGLIFGGSFFYILLIILIVKLASILRAHYDAAACPAQSAQSTQSAPYKHALAKVVTCEPIIPQSDRTPALFRLTLYIDGKTYEKITNKQYSPDESLPANVFRKTGYVLLLDEHSKSLTADAQARFDSIAYAAEHPPTPVQSDACADTARPVEDDAVPAVNVPPARPLDDSSVPARPARPTVGYKGIKRDK